ncbi:MAG: DUF6637 family protein [Brotaphodocola sp.]
MIHEKKKNPRSIAMYLDIMHIAAGILIVLCAVLAFLDPDNNQFLFPVIFWMAAFLNGASGWYQLGECGRDKKKKAEAVCRLTAAAVLAVIGAVSAISIWR